MLEDMKRDGQLIPTKQDDDYDNVTVEDVPLAEHHKDPENKPYQKLREPLMCFACYQPYTELHHFYHQMCKPCADLNWEKRSQKADFSGKHALITGMDNIATNC
jgi:hypothetical protein